MTDGMEDRRRRNRREGDYDHDLIITMHERVNTINEKLKDHLDNHKKFFWIAVTLIMGQFVILIFTLLKESL